MDIIKPSYKVFVEIKSEYIFVANLAQCLVQSSNGGVFMLFWWNHGWQEILIWRYCGQEHSLMNKSSWKRTLKTNPPLSSFACLPSYVLGRACMLWLQYFFLSESQYNGDQKKKIANNLKTECSERPAFVGAFPLGQYSLSYFLLHPPPRQLQSYFVINNQGSVYGQSRYSLCLDWLV